jgi:subtilisin-like proprotein convertase family protein/uncharacterized protein YvpB
MCTKKPSSLGQFFILVVFLFLFLISLPGVAITTAHISPTVSDSYTPSSSILQSNLNNHNPFYLISEEEVNTQQSNPTPSATHTFTLADTNLLTPTHTSTPTITPTLVISPTETPNPRPTSFIWLPVLHNLPFIPTYTPSPIPSPPEQILFCDNLGQSIYIPDNDGNGIIDEILIFDDRLLVNLSVYLNISHSWIGDLVVTLTNQHTGEKITVLDRPGIPNSLYGCSSDNIITILDDAAAQSVDNKCAYNPAISGIYLPTEELSSFAGKSVSGIWKINVSDHSLHDIGFLNHWCLFMALSDTMPSPTPTPTPVSLPEIAFVSGMTGQDQQFNLDCESRSAVDWAKYFGLTIDELDLLNHLPKSDDPEEGFVGDPQGTWGNIPPDDYGVHAPPVADLLRDFGATASSHRSLQWDDLRAEIASGNPVIVWIIGGNSYNIANGIPQFYTPTSTNHSTIVARREHTVILVGYTPTSVTVLNGSKFVEIPLNQFLDSWSVLQFMAVLARP